MSDMCPQLWNQVWLPPLLTEESLKEPFWGQAQGAAVVTKAQLPLWHRFSLRALRCGSVQGSLTFLCLPQVSHEIQRR